MLNDLIITNVMKKNDSNSFDNVNLLIDAIIDKNDEKQCLSRNEDQQMKQLIDIINKESNYEVIFKWYSNQINSSTNTQITIPHYLKLKTNDNNQIEIYSVDDILIQCKVNETVENLLNKQNHLNDVEIESIETSQIKESQTIQTITSFQWNQMNDFEVKFPKDYLKKRFNDFEVEE